MTKNTSFLNRLTVGQLLRLVYSEEEYPVYCIVENGVIYLIEEGVEHE